MKRTLTFFVFSIMLMALGLFGCAAPAPIPPTIAPTSIPTLVPPTATSSPVPTTRVNADKTVRDAFAKFVQAKSFRMNSKSEVSALFFEAQLPNDTREKILIFDARVGQNGADSLYALKGFVASFIGLFSGFDPESEALDILSLGDTVYMRGKLEKETQARWYKLSAQDAQGTTTTPTNFLMPMTSATYGDNAFSKTGVETIGSQACDVFTGSRAAFDAVFPQIAKSALLNPETVDLTTIDRAEFQVWVCADGNVYRVAYNFDAHSKTDASKKGAFTFDAQLADFGADIQFQAPTDAQELPSLFGTPSETATPTSVGETKTFTSLDGDWEGTDSEDSPLSFTVEDDKITFANVNYFVQSGGCSFSGTIANSLDDAAIANSAFTFTLTNSDDVKFTVAGKFVSNNAASGTLKVKGKTFCGDTDAETKWTARHISAPASAELTPQATATTPRTPTVAATRTPSIAPTAQPTIQPTATTAPSTGSAALVQAAFDALKRNDVDGALAYCDPNVVYDLAGRSGIGTQSLRTDWQLAMFLGTQYSLSNLQEVGGIATFTVTVTGFGAGVYTNSSAIVQNGKITILTVE